ncbi:MAG TPA: peptidase M20 [Cyanobacteria bacterium UBA8530]|nr:peptidase M20 [Cyanobacteria bacterium UBA8530]
MKNRDRLVQTFLDLVRIDSPSGKEEACALWVKNHLEGLGYRPTLHKGNLLLKIKGDKEGPKILFSTHLDTVQPGEGVKPKIVDPDGNLVQSPYSDDAIIRSSGDTILGADDKAGIAAILEVLATLKEENFPIPDLRFAFTVGEEIGLLGAKSLDKEVLDSDWGYVLDSSGPVGAIIHQAPAQDNIRIEVRGRAAHAGIAPEAGLNAIMVAGQILTKLPLGRIDAETTSNIGKITGGVATNIVPERVVLEGEARSRSLEKLDALVAQMQDIALDVAEAFGATAEIEVDRRYPSFSLPESASVIRAFLKAAEGIGLSPTVQGSGGGSDGNIFNSLGLPTAVLGMSWQDIHTTEERISVGNLVRIAKLVRAVIETCAEEETKW